MMIEPKDDCIKYGSCEIADENYSECPDDCHAYYPEQQWVEDHAEMPFDAEDEHEFLDDDEEMFGLTPPADYL